MKNKRTTKRNSHKSKYDKMKWKIRLSEKVWKPLRKNQGFLTSKMQRAWLDSIKAIPKTKNIKNDGKSYVNNRLQETLIFIKNWKLFKLWLSLSSLPCWLHCFGVLLWSLSFNSCYEPLIQTQIKFQQVLHYFGLIITFIADIATMQTLLD